MAYVVFTESPSPNYPYEDQHLVSIRVDGKPWQERRTRLCDISRRRWSFPLGRPSADRVSVDDFVTRARAVQYEAFLMADPRDYAITGVALGTGDGSTTTFSLPTTGENRRYYARQGTLVGRVNGAPASVASYSTDGRTVTFTAAPANGTTLTCDFTGLRLCRVESLSWQGQTNNWFEGSLEIVEIISE